VKNTLLCLLLTLLCATPAVAQETTTSDAPTKEQVQEFFTLMQIKQRMVQLMDGMKAAQKKGAEEGFKHSLPNATPEQIAKVDSLADQVFQGIPRFAH
jgi:hypothetical protein